uniref:Rhodanese domain-containing protein n=1 Tax=Ditylenchus dipsaci TaxID=166011 RepID=A0A915DUC4_9BILA
MSDENTSTNSSTNENEDSFVAATADQSSSGTEPVSCWCRRSLTSSSSERFIRFLFDKLKNSSKLKFRKIMLLKGGFFGFQKQFPELCESSAQLRKSSSVSGQQSATTPFPPATAGCLLLQQHPTRFNCNNNSFSTPSDVNGNLSFKLAMEGQRAPQIESQQLLGACAPSNNCSTSKVMLRGNSSQQQNGLATAPLL